MQMPFLAWSLNQPKMWSFDFGRVITAIITFLITAFVLFLIVKAVNKLRNLKQQPEEEEVPEVTAEDYLEEIRDLLKAQTPPANTVDPRQHHWMIRSDKKRLLVNKVERSDSDSSDPSIIAQSSKHANPL